jgi:hypothetical protein
MPKFSKHSLDRLEEADPLLQVICNEAIKKIDFSVICAYRGKDEQNLAFKRGNSKLKYPNSRHNHLPSFAVDLYPYPVDLKDIKRFHELAEIMLKTSDIVLKDSGYFLRWGGNYKGNFKDYPHFELIEL